MTRPLQVTSTGWVITTDPDPLEEIEAVATIEMLHTYKCRALPRVLERKGEVPPWECCGWCPLGRVLRAVAELRERRRMG